MLKDLRLLACHLNDNSSERPRRIRESRSSWGARSEEDRMLDAGGFPRRRTAAQPLWLTKHQDPREADERCTGAQSSHNRSRPSGCFWSDACLYPHRLGVSARGDQNAGHRDLAHLDSTWPPQPNSIGVAARSSKEWQSTGAWSAVYRPNVRDYEVFSHADSHPKCNTCFRSWGAGILRLPLSGQTGVATWDITNSPKKNDTSFPRECEAA